MRRFARIIARSQNGKRIVCIDSLNYEIIESYIMQDQRHTKKFRHIVQIILEGLRNSELYDKEDIDRKSKGVTAMKFFKGQENDRIYCKEFTRNGKVFVVVCSGLLIKKKTNKITSREKRLVHKVASYEYDIEEEIDENES